MNYMKQAIATLIDKYGNNCSICGKHLSGYDISIDHIIPISLGGTSDLSNCRLACRSCNHKRGANITGYEFEKYVAILMNKNSSFRNIQLGIPIGEDKNYVPDIVVEVKKNNKWVKAVVEVKSSTSFTFERAMSIITRFNGLRKYVKDASFIILFPGKISDKLYSAFKQNHIEVWDIDYLISTFSTEIKNNTHPAFQTLLSNSKKFSENTLEDELINKLNKSRAGRVEWSKYQKLIGEILTLLFSPPLLQPLHEKSDASRANRRDFIFPNYCDTGFWSFLRSRYNADYIVVDAKNRTKKIDKKDILQIANYLKLHGTGLFGIIVSRTSASEGALYTLKEVWALERKLIVILQDNDIEQMLINKKADRDPMITIRQKIEDFRLQL